MAKTNVKKIGNIERPKNTTRNDFTSVNEYGQPNTISPIGRDPDGAGNIGTSIDLAARQNNITKNYYSNTRPYTISDTE